jgi:hypothetical protein
MWRNHIRFTITLSRDKNEAQSILHAALRDNLENQRKSCGAHFVICCSKFENRKVKNIPTIEKRVYCTHDTSCTAARTVGFAEAQLAAQLVVQPHVEETRRAGEVTIRCASD